LQGKQEQADAIERLILKTTQVPWPVFDEARLRETLTKMFREQAPGSKHKSQLYDYAACFDEPTLAYSWLIMPASSRHATCASSAQRSVGATTCRISRTTSGTSCDYAASTASSIARR
jgi:hypothetical protein